MTTRFMTSLVLFSLACRSGVDKSELDTAFPSTPDDSSAGSDAGPADVDAGSPDTDGGGTTTGGSSSDDTATTGGDTSTPSTDDTGMDTNTETGTPVDGTAPDDTASEADTASTDTGPVADDEDTSDTTGGSGETTADATDTTGGSGDSAGDDDGAITTSEVIDYCHVQYPCELTSPLRETLPAVYIWVYEAGTTDRPGEGEGIEVHLGIGADGTIPDEYWSWTDAYYHEDKDGLEPGDGANDEYEAIAIAPETLGVYDYAARVRVTGGAWTLCDLGHECSDGTGSDDGYSPATAGALIVTP